MSSPLDPIHDPLGHALTVLAGGERLGEQEVADAFGVLMRGEGAPEQAAALLMGMRVQGEGGTEVAGAARALQGVMRRVATSSDAPVVDTAGTGGGVISTFNVSTAAAVVAAAAGATVAKHGNRSHTSKCGSADVLEALGVNIAAQADAAEVVLREVGMVFLFAPAFHPAMRFVAPVRRSLAVPTVMNLVGPLVNPAGARRQVVGAADPRRAAVLADALRRLGTEHALVVHADVGMDEIAPAGLTQVWEVRDGEVRHWELDPASVGASAGDLDRLRGGLPEENARRIVDLFAAPEADPVGEATVALNAGAALYVSGQAASIAEGVTRARAALADGAAQRILEALRRAPAASSGG